MTTLAEAPTVVGSTLPRLFTPPLVTGPPGACGCGCALTRATTDGFELVSFAEEINHPLLPFQRFAAIHGLEKLPDGRPRFRIVIMLVARQNGKTTLPKVMCAWWQFRKRVPLIMGTSTKLEYAKDAWNETRKLVESRHQFNALRAPGRKWYRRTNGETESWTLNEESRYKISAANEEGGRSQTIDRAVCDELRQHHDYSAWDALEPACSPPDAQIWALSNAGSLKSVVLNDHQDEATRYIETGQGDPRLGLFEWSSPPGSEVDDVNALLQANPRVGHGLDLEVLLTAAARARRLGGEALTGFQTERMCIRVKVMAPAIAQADWRECAGAPEAFDDLRGRVVLVAEVAESLQSASLYAAAVQPDGRVRVGPVDAWYGPKATERMRRDLPGLVADIKPRKFGWLPTGPSSALAATLKDRTAAGRRGAWPPPGVVIEEIRAEVPAVCAGFAEQVATAGLWHTDDPRLNAQVSTAEWAPRGDARVFMRRGVGECDALYAAAGAAHLARTLPGGLGTVRVLLPTVRNG